MIIAKTGKKNRLSNERTAKKAALVGSSKQTIDSARVKEVRESLGLKEYEKFYANLPHQRIDRYTRTKRNMTIRQPFWFIDSVGIISNTGLVDMDAWVCADMGLLRVVKL